MYKSNRKQIIKKERKNDNLKKKKDIMKKLLIILAIFIINSLSFINAICTATYIDSAYMYSSADCGELLKYKGAIVEASYVQYSYEGVDYPAYCLDKTKEGAQDGPYTVSVKEAITDVGLWRVIINGYPYKSIQELGVANKEEAFMATKQAVYCYIHKNNLNDYEGIGEAGKRTLDAMYRITDNANKCTETKISSTIEINKEDKEWKQDELNPEYVSKIFSVSAGAGMKNYKIQIKKENAQNIGGIKVTNMKNEETNEFASEEKFKVLVPIREMTQKGSFQLTVESQVQTKPILYGVAPDSSKQDYALTTMTYEDGAGEKRDEYPENETKIIIIKRDDKTKEKLEGVEFELLDENKKVVYSNLKTDKEGKIEVNHLIPGKYYLKETKAKEGYEAYEELIKLEVALHEQYTVTVNNNQEEIPKIEIQKSEKNKEVSSSNVKKLHRL